MDDGAREHLFSFDQDWKNLGGDFARDLECLCSKENAVLLLIAGGASFAVHGRIDDRVADNTARHLHRWGDAQDFFTVIGNPAHHLAASTGLYAYSLYTEDPGLHDLSKTLFESVAITGAANILLKEAFYRTTAPNREKDPFGGSFPSGHASSSAAVAAVLDEYYGHRVGLPAYALAGLVCWERIDDREHDLSDVIFGAALGYVIGKTIAADHHARFCGMEVEPYIDPWTGATGVSLERSF